MAHRIDTSTADLNKHGPGKAGFVKGDPSSGVPSTRLSDDWCDDIQENICRAVEAAGIVLEKGNHTQLTDAIVKMIETRETKGLKKSCRVAATGNIVLSGLQLIDGVQTVAGDRVLVPAQTAGAENGLYVAAAGAWTRATDADDGAEISHGALVPVEEGTTSADTLWMVATDGTVTIGATALSFKRVGADSLPIGCVLAHSGTAAPPGYLIANGAAVARATYTQLDAAMYVGDAANATAAAWYRCTNPASPSTTRNVAGDYIVLPDYRGVTLRGLDLGRGLDPDSATRLVNAYQADNVKDHTHTFRWSATNAQSSDTSTAGGVMTNLDGGVSAGVSFFSEVSGGGAETRGKNVAVLWCVKAFSATTNQGLIDITALANDVALRVPYSAFTGSNQNIAASGYQKLPGGMIIQWGTTPSIAAGSYVNVTLPIAFPNACLAVVSQAQGTNNTTNTSIPAIQVLSSSQVRIWQWGSSGNFAAFYVAIGW